MPSMENRMEFGHDHIMKAWREWSGPAYSGTGIGKQSVKILMGKVNDDVFICIFNIWINLFLFLVNFLSNKSSELFICDYFLLMTTGLTICRSSLTIYSEV